MGKLIGQPAPAFSHNFRLGGADFFFQFPQGGRARSLAGVDSTLWHLPGLRGYVDAARHEDAP